MISSNTLGLVSQLAELAASNNRILTAAESCTGGLIAAAMTEVSGSSAWFDRGFVTYSNGAKRQMLEVPQALLDKHGAVSKATVLAMAKGAIAQSDANLAVAVSGVAGPAGGTAEKPVGTVWIACAGVGISAVAELYVFSGDRAAVRIQTVDKGLHLLIGCIKNESL